MREFNQLYLQDYNSLYTDYKTEVIAHHIWSNYKDIDGVFLKRLGGNNRSFYKDLKRIKAEYVDVKSLIVSVESYREGIYDYLPEGLFHPPSFRSTRENISNVVEQIRQEKRVEQKARSFFQPFELEVYFSQLKAIDLAVSFDGLTKEDAFLAMAGELWPLVKLLDAKNAKVFTSLLPYFHRERGKKDWMEKCLSACLSLPVSIGFVPNIRSAQRELSSSLLLDNWVLGINSVLDGQHFDGEKNWKIDFGPISYDALPLYLEGSALRTLLQAIYDYCLPVTVSVVECFITHRQADSFQLDTNHCSLLGYSTYL